MKKLMGLPIILAVLASCAKKQEPLPAPSDGEEIVTISVTGMH